MTKYTEKGKGFLLVRSDWGLGTESVRGTIKGVLGRIGL